MPGKDKSGFFVVRHIGTWHKYHVANKYKAVTSLCCMYHQYICIVVIVKLDVAYTKKTYPGILNVLCPDKT